MFINYEVLIDFMTILTSVMIVFVLFMSIYYLTFWSISARKIKPVPHSDKFTEFAILIAARNESKVIAHILESLKKQTYPREHFEVYVIVEKESEFTELTNGYAKPNFVYIRSVSVGRASTLSIALKSGLSFVL